MNNRKAILIIEDNPLLTGLYSAGFKKNGLDVTIVHSGEEGLKMIDETSPDIVLLDLFMPGMDGIQVLEKIRSNPRTKDMKVVVLTINDKGEVREKAKELGVVDYLLKQDLHLDEIVRRVVAHIS